MDWKTTWQDGDAVHAVDFNRLEENGQGLEMEIEGAKAFFAVFGSTNATAVEKAYQANKAIFCIKQDTNSIRIAPLGKRSSADNFTFFDGASAQTYNVFGPSWTHSLVKYDPKPHGSNHSASGNDPITPEDIGAVSYEEFKNHVDSVYGNGSDSGLMSAEDKTKLDGIEPGANNYVHPSSHPATMITGLASVAKTGNYNDLSNKPTIRDYSAGSGMTSSMSASGTVTFNVDSVNAVTQNSTKPIQSGAVYTALSGKSPTGHTHGTADITGLSEYVRKGTQSNNTIGSYGAAAFGNGTTASGDASFAEGTSTKAQGPGSHAEGYGTTASGNQSHAEGYNSTASGNESHAEGVGTTASGAYSHAEGHSTTASGTYSHAGGYGSEAVGNNSFAHGFQAYAEATDSVAMGNGVYSKINQFVCGKFNLAYKGTPNNSQVSTDTIFNVGNGTSASARDSALLVQADGSCLNGSGVYSEGADFAEYFEWADGNPDDEDRRGRFVALEGEKIRFATSDDDYILGVVSSVGAVIGNSASLNWKGRYVTDVFGARLYQEVEIPESVDENSGETIPAHTVKQWVINPEYNPEEGYISRRLRKEWSPVGMLGQIVVVDDGTCQVNGYCAPSTDGVATASTTGYRVMKRVDENHIKVLVK